RSQRRLYLRQSTLLPAQVLVEKRQIAQSRQEIALPEVLHIADGTVRMNGIGRQLQRMEVRGTQSGEIIPANQKNHLAGPVTCPQQQQKLVDFQVLVIERHAEVEVTRGRVHPVQVARHRVIVGNVRAKHRRAPEHPDGSLPKQAWQLILAK